MNEAYNMDCMDFMRSQPDKAFDLAVVDPPYGGGFTEGGGCKGWFSKYHQDGGSQNVKVERERESRTTDSAGGLISTSVNRTGGTWARKYAKKS